MFARILHAYGRIPPSMLGQFRWRMSALNAEMVARQAGMRDADAAVIKTAEGLTMLGIPVDIVEGDEILLVMTI